ncbi:MAG TPA: tripartite tricarboxylate transporter substrate-binding protein [Xanthobacteraceae bacterium]|jgi:tripartite-type tricarboxylate transporter receptor subunit TctC
MVVGFSAGGMVDIVTRLIGEKLSEQLGQSVVIENRGGAAGNIASKMVSTAEANGYTVLVTSSAIAVNAIAAAGAVDPRSELATIAVIASAPTIFVAKRSTPPVSLMEFVRSKKNGQLTFATSGPGTVDHLTAEYLFRSVPGLNATHVPYASGSEIINAVLGGHVDMAVTTPPAALSFIKDDGNLGVLAVTSPKRIAMLPDVPTAGEIGFPGLDSASWVALFAPAGVPRTVIDTLNGAVVNALEKRPVQERLAAIGYELHPGSPAEGSAFVKSEVAKWAKIIKAIGFTVN